ncbi:P-loop containing nucleoside triphosphate hydrolase protein [Nemania abortiva]|nr:P-loop containing nucleoside triphosphate hydrolase protein [Nemania abortiva]
MPPMDHRGSIYQMYPPPPPQHFSRPGLRGMPEDEESSSSDASTVSEKETIDKTQIGMTSETKNLFRDDHRAPWEERPMENIDFHSTSVPASAKFALIVRREKKNGDDGEPVLILHSITIQSPLIKDQLKAVFAGYQGINTGLKKLNFMRPFREFYYRWDRFVQAAPSRERGASAMEVDGDHPIGKSHYDLLFNAISSEVIPHIDQTTDLLENGVISFDYVWALFEPGTEVYSKVEGHDRLYLLNRGDYQVLQNGMRVYNLSCRYIETDGETFGYATTMLTIMQFEDLMPFADLSVLPSHLKEGIPEIKARLEERGRKFESLKGFHYKSYSGAYLLQRAPFGQSRKQFIDDGRMIIDCGSFIRYNADAAIQLSPLDAHSTIAYGEDHAEFAYHNGFDDPGPVAAGHYHTRREMSRQGRRRVAPVQQNSRCATFLTDKHYALCTNVVKGYSLASKEWVYLDVDLIQEIEWKDKAFEQLVLPHEYKRLIWAFVTAQLSHLDDFDDIIKGKGKGIIMLLSGEPGTGKTLTSESVSEAMRKPLYSMSAGELGNHAEEVEAKLRQVLELSAKWNAVLLIDECDVFLERRSKSDLHRNKLVSVFLRLLEYYEGVLFLTTNRVEAFDPAFESRIHLTINYPKLDLESRLHIWRTFLKVASMESGSGDGGGISEAELMQIARVELNGRQIKNVVKTARLLAAQEKSTLKFDHLQTVTKVKGHTVYADFLF